MTSMHERWDSLCHFNPTADLPEVDPEQDCGAAAVWHLIAREGASGGVECYQSCEFHLGRALLMDGVEEFHEYGSACGLEGSHWVFALATCATEETLLVNGYAWIEVPDVYSKPLHPLPGTFVKILDIGQWVQFRDGLWIEAQPPEGAMT